jgi:hypothetical protein
LKRRNKIWPLTMTGPWLRHCLELLHSIGENRTAVSPSN